MRDLEAATYGIRGGQGNSLLKAAGVVGGLGSAHDGSLGGLTGGGPTAVSALYNIAYGKKVWSMINQECNALAMLPKRPYTASGWRVLEKRAAGGGNNKFNSGAFDTSNTVAKGADSLRADMLGAYGENAPINADSDTTIGTISAITPTYAQLKTSPKTVAHLFEFSELALEMAKIDDGVGDIRALIREDMGKHHAEVQNAMLLLPLEQYDVGGKSYAEQNVGLNYTSLMKIVSSKAEIGEMYNEDMLHDGKTDASTGAEPQVYTLYGNTARNPGTSSGANGAITVSGDGGFIDSYVDYGGDYSATRPLTLTILNKALRNIREAGGSPKVILTGYDTIQHIGDLLQSQERFMDRKEIIPTHNGVRGVKGSEVGFRVATYFDIPIIPCKDMPSTTKTAAATDLSDMLILDTDHLWLSVMKPTQYFEDGIDHGNPFGVAKLGNQAMYRTIAETGCSFFKGQGKITNLSSA